MRYLVTGKNGQLARSFLRRFESSGTDHAAPDENVADITDPVKIRELMTSYRPDVVINCAAYNLVDRAEEDRDTAFKVNAVGPAILAEAAQACGAYFVHFGSDYVFDGSKETGLYREDDTPNPLSVYGSSKRQGEENALRNNDKSLVLRLSWVFGEGKQNFIVKLIEWSARSGPLKVTCDEFSVPTSTETVVDVTLRAVQRGATGMFHLTNSGYCSRYEWAKLIVKEMGIDKFIRPVTMASFPLPAKRPAFSAMDNRAIGALTGISIPSWEDAVRSFLRGHS
ncbi:MAG: dTDP-4-dehydrorhamnose reductase [Nitrospirota bacterium]|nr:dTDP-4-dehydrorhamnose reductase [Nitrospirota bacterium]